MRVTTLLAFASVSTLTGAALADDSMGAPPPDATALVAAPKAAEDAPTIDKPQRETTATVSAGAQESSGNSRLFAATLNGKLTLRREANGYGASLLGNYGKAPTGTDGTGPLKTNVENLQGTLRYDRYLIDSLSLFLLTTGRHDRFQGLDFRLNLDPGAKYLFVNTDPTTFWGELGYDFQYDVRQDAAIEAETPKLAKTATDNSLRGFIGLKHAFNDKVTFTTGVEYLQSLVETKRARLNYDALFAANVAGGFSLGVGFSLRYDHDPLPGKKDLDTATTLSLIYSFSDAAPPPAPAPVPCVPPPAEPPAAPVPTPDANPPPALPVTPPALPPDTTTPPGAAPEAPPDSPPVPPT
jgi:putative salt-induced outer membrane protein YdiY